MKSSYQTSIKFMASFLMTLFIMNFVFVSRAVPAGTSFENEISLRDGISGIDPIVTGSANTNTGHTNYCINILDEAKETRNAVLTARLTGLQKEIDGKLDLMSERIETLKTWTSRREDFLAKANASLIEIFQTMRPDAAASQLAEMGPAMSAAIIAKLEPKYSSAIMTEMKPEDAAKITTVLANVMVTNAAN